MENSLATISTPRTSKQLVSSSEVIREFLVKAGAVYSKEITAALVSIWIDELSEHPPERLAFLFGHVLRTCKFFPTIADVLEPLRTVKQAALPEEANNAWLKVLSIRREHFNPDFPEYLTRALKKLPERVQQAARAAGVFQEVSNIDQLHVWGKKRFLESYLRWEEIEENQFLLPDDFRKDFAALAQLKTLVKYPGKSASINS